MKYLFILLLNVVATFSSLPPVQQKCSAWDYICLTTSVQSLIPHIANVGKEVGHTHAHALTIHQDKLLLNLEHLEIKSDYLPYYNVENVNLDKNLKLIRGVFRIPYLVYKAKYNVTGHLHELPIHGEGDMFIKSSNVLIDMTIPYTITKSLDGKHYFDLTGYTYWFDKSHSHIIFDNLYNGNEIESNATHLFMQQHWKPLTNQFGRSLLDVYIDHIFNLLKKLSSLNPVEHFVNEY